MKFLRRINSESISTVLIVGILTVATTMHPNTALSDNTGILEKNELVHMLIGKTMPVGNPRSKVYFASSSMATILLLEGDSHGETEDVNWTINEDSQFCFTAILIDGIESCYEINRLKSGNFRVSVERGEWRSSFRLPKGGMIDGKDF
ncbi:MAG: hypothetical protein AB8B79_19735 [Granulosicoccus sp.]